MDTPFLCKLNEWEGGGNYRLPTEAQWEYACRAGTETPRYPHDIDAAAWYAANSKRQPQPVGQKLPNVLGLFDMLGNVWEWCYDGKRNYTADAVVDPMGPIGANALRVYRGGSWGYPVRFMRAATRGWREPSYRYDIGLGFRCACSATRR